MKIVGFCSHEGCQLPYRVVYEFHGIIIESIYDEVDKGKVVGIKMYHIECYEKHQREVSDEVHR